MWLALMLRVKKDYQQSTWHHYYPQITACRRWSPELMILKRWSGIGFGSIMTWYGSVFQFIVHTCCIIHKIYTLLSLSGEYSLLVWLVYFAIWCLYICRFVFCGVSITWSQCFCKNYFYNLKHSAVWDVQTCIIDICRVIGLHKRRSSVSLF